MPWARQAPRIVVPAGTVTAAPSMVSSIGGGASTTGAAAASTRGRAASAGCRSAAARRAPRRGAACAGSGAGSRSMLRPSLTAPPARAGAARTRSPTTPSGRARRSRRRASPGRSREECQLLVPWPDARPRGEPRQQLLLADAPDPARDALAARLVAEELGDAPEGVDEVGRLVEDHDHAGPEGRRRWRASPRTSAACRGHPARRRRPAAPPSRIVRISAPAGHAAGQVDEVAQRRPEFDLVRARAARRGRTGRRASARSRPPAPIRGVGLAAHLEDERDVGQRLDVVHDGRLAEQPDLDRERRLVARLAALALDRLEEGRLLAADVGAGAAAELDVEGEARAEDVGRGGRRRARPRSRGSRVPPPPGTRRGGRGSPGGRPSRRPRSSSPRRWRTGRPRAAPGP